MLPIRWTLDQARILSVSLHRILEALIGREVPVHFLKFPKFAEDITYLHRRLVPVLGNATSFAEFSKRAAPVIDADKVRTTGELAMASRRDAAPSSGTARHCNDAVELPSFDTLDRIALKRELRSVAAALRQVTV